MIITFCGHSDFSGQNEYEKKLLDLLEELAGDEPVEFFLGNYGNFDHFASQCCLTYKKSHPNASLVFVTPYRDETYLEHHLPADRRYDSILYPDIEDKPLRFAILYRNKYMVEQADYVIAYIDRSLGGAYTAYKHAKKKGRVIYNLSGKNVE